MKAGKGKYILGSIFFAVVTLYLVHPFALGAIGRHLVVAEDPIKPADAIVVVGRDKQGQRIEYAANLFKQGVGGHLIISSRQIGWRTNEAEIMQRHARALGVPGDAILIDRDGTTPTVQAEHTKEVMVRQHLRSAILVSSSHHSAQVADAFKTVLNPVGISIKSAPVANQYFDPSAWWTTRKGAKIVFNEYWERLWSDMED